MGEIRAFIETRAGLRFSRMAESLDVQVEETLQGLATDLELVYQSVAPKRDTRLARGITSVRRGALVFEIVSNATDPQTGYRYTGVTRFGHKKLFIKPKVRSRATVLATHTLRGRGRSAALRIVLPSGEIIFRKQVKGYRPTHDWVEDGKPIAQREAHAAAMTLGQKVITRVT